MAALSEKDKTLSVSQQAQIQAAKDAWAAAKAAGDTAGMEAAHAQAEAVRNAAGYSGGADGSGSTVLSQPVTVVTTPSGKTAAYGENGIRQPAVVNGNSWSGNGASGYFKTPEDYAKDTTDYAAKMLQAQSYDEFKHWQRQRELKAEAQGIDLSGDGVTSNDDLYREWHDAYTQSDEYKRLSAPVNGGAAPVVPSGGGVVVNPYYSQQQTVVTPNIGGGDLSGYIQEIYRQQMDAEQAALESAYRQNVLQLRDQRDDISPLYTVAANQMAAQNRLDEQNWNMIAAANGMSSGARGQAALSRQNAYQNSLSSLLKSEAEALAENDLAAAQLATQYQTAIAQAEASGNAAMAEALYQEYVRQIEALQEQQKISFQQNMQQAQWDASQQENARSYALTVIGMGAMPDPDTLRAAGISEAEAAAMLSAVVGSSKSASSGTVKKSVTPPASSADSSANKAEWEGIDQASVIALGRGMITSQELERLVESGEVGYTVSNGVMKFHNITTPSAAPGANSALMNSVLMR